MSRSTPQLEMLKMLVVHTETIEMVTVGTPLGQDSPASNTFVETTEGTIDEAIDLCEDRRPLPPSSITEVSSSQCYYNSGAEHLSSWRW